MADHAAGDDIFVYTGGRAPQHVVNAIIDESVEEIDNNAFYNNRNLKSVVCHDGVLKVRRWTFGNCRSLQRVKMPGVKIIEERAFHGCKNLVYVEFDKLETVGNDAFNSCSSLQRIELPKVKTIGIGAFANSGVEELELGEELETIGSGAFRGSKLRRIAIPLKDDMFQWDDWYEDYTQFRCPILRTVDLVGGIHKTVSSLHLESWRDEMSEEIQRINQILPGTVYVEKTDVIRQWMQSVKSRFEHYKAEHRVLLNEATTLLELALWKAKIDDFKVEGDKDSVAEDTAMAKIDVGEARKKARITSGADIIIKNVLPYLKMEKME
jgi:hypothetical protein